MMTVSEPNIMTMMAEGLGLYDPRPLSAEEIDKIEALVGLSPYTRAKLELWSSGVFPLDHVDFTLRSIELRLRTRNVLP